MYDVLPKLGYVLNLRLLQRGLEDINSYFRHANSNSSQQQQGKLDDRLQPIPAEIHGAVVRTDPELLKYYENQGNK